MTKRKSTKHCT